MRAVTHSDLHSRRLGHPLANQAELAELLVELRRYGVEPPADTVRALELLVGVQQVRRPANFRAWLASADLDDLDVETVWEFARSALTDTGLTTGGIGPNVLGGIHTELVNHAAAALVSDLDRILSDLRPTWDQAAKVVTSAANTGLRSSTTPTEVIDLGNDAVEAWRNSQKSLSVLDRLWTLRNKLALLADYEIRDSELGQQGWLDRAANGSLDLALSKRTDEYLRRRRRRQQQLAVSEVPA